MEHLVSKPSLACRHVVRHPVLMYMCWESPTFKNVYESFSDFLSVFEAALTLQWDFPDLEVMLSNVKENSPFFPVFEAFRRLYGGRGLRYSTQWYKNGTCFRSLALPPSPGLSTLSANRGRAGQTRCRAPVLAAAVTVIRGLFPEARGQPPAHCLLALMHRGSGQRSMDSQRVVLGVTLALKKKPNLGKYSALVYDPVGKPLHEGISVMASTAVLFGLHGAGLTHALFLQTSAVLLELFCGDRTSSNGHYKTIAAMMGIRYHLMSQGNCASYLPAAVAAKVLEAVPTEANLTCMS
eukprot:CAMPEP_0179141416 /NCGR_PEP_ID=MMETSP0796-20121207/67821_1 /TAXON_ID=73915 /ORGANISM="Pyrodinium bahamense, Strain pbaha01" /LENGTH=294 /DNA_ID=CAMNT_0020841131 /DNA_START=191 /DNA_END=1075 /DNA_ORIENTATION=-